MNVSMNLKRFNCLDELARDNEYKRLDEGVVALLARLGPLERLHLDEFKLLDEFERGNEHRRLKRLDGLERDNDNEYGRLDSSRGRGSTLGMYRQGRGSTLGTS